MYQQFLKTLEEMAGHKGIQMRAVDGSLVNAVWAQDGGHDMPDLPDPPVFVQDLKFAGKSVAEKLSDLAGVCVHMCAHVRRPAGARASVCMCVCVCVCAGGCFLKKGTCWH